ncbi:hypothetical protein P4679_23270 [Priestia megaterium]|uniref:hypothetical protein n=1 Tax=Priestia megaterium TaxID=1404 RepID=UPI002E1DB65A|nr:hypothetical protein [Priestia megaterium]
MNKKSIYKIIFASVIVSKIFAGLLYILLFYGYFEMFLIMDFIFLPFIFFIAEFRREKRAWDYNVSFWNTLFSTAFVAGAAMIIATVLLACFSGVYIMSDNTMAHFLTYNIIFMLSTLFAQWNAHRKQKGGVYNASSGRSSYNSRSSYYSNQLSTIEKDLNEAEISGNYDEVRALSAEKDDIQREIDHIHFEESLNKHNKELNNAEEEYNEAEMLKDPALMYEANQKQLEVLKDRNNQNGNYFNQ